MLPILQIGPLALPAPQFSLLLALWFGLSIAEKYAPRHGVSASALYNLTFTGLIAGLVAARIGYVLQYPGAFIQSPASLVSLNPGLLDPFSAIGVALIAMLVYGQRTGLHFWSTLDALTPLLATMAVGLAMANIASGQAFGSETHLPWGIELWGAKRHPSQFYELLAALAILILLGRMSKSDPEAGSLFLSFIGLQAGTRLFLEAFRGDSSLVWGGMRAAQITAWAVLAIVFLGLELIKSRREPQSEEN